MSTSETGSLIISEAGEDEQDGVYVVGIGTSLDDPQPWSLLFMESLADEDELDIEPDEDSAYCLVVDPGQAAHYGGVRECQFVGDQLRLVLTDEAAQTLGIPVETTFILNISAAQQETLKRGLRRVLVSGHADFTPHILDA